MDNSSSYTNAILLILYLFAAIFVLLSIFLTILGEHQGHVRDEEKEAKEAGTRAPDYGIFSFLAAGMSGEVNGCIGHIKAKVRPQQNQRTRTLALTPTTTTTPTPTLTLTLTLTPTLTLTLTLPQPQPYP